MTTTATTTAEAEQVDINRVYWAADRTAAEWAALARGLRATMSANYTQAVESFERCDTDGFVSQWANGCMADYAETGAALADAEGWWTFRALIDAETGEVASLDCVASERYRGSYYWRLTDAYARPRGIKPFVNDSNAEDPKRYAATMRRKGFTVGTVRARGRALMVGTGTGLSGVHTVRSEIAPIRELLHTTVVVVRDNSTEPADQPTG
jgi:hypothetical protein